MAMWNRCAICGKSIPVGELCYGVKNWRGDPIGGDTICRDCLVPENAPILTPPNEWVSVEERLPEQENTQVLMTDGECHYISSRNNMVRFLDCEGIFIPGKAGAGVKVTHWMPLPKSPKEDE